MMHGNTKLKLVPYLFIEHVTSNKFIVLTMQHNVCQHQNHVSSSYSYQQTQRIRENVTH